ncbi:MAG: nuclear transport factor 2 family protein [Nodosilinea sp.]
MPTRMADATLDLAAVSPAVDRYFAGFNAEDYRAVAALFEADGVLLAPFEEPIVGPEAIYVYLQAEAINMRATPVEVETTPNADDTRQVVVKGRVKTLLFTVNVRWTFVIGPDDTLQSTEIKLLASLQELMQIDRGEEE